jgi:hypothetical protein
MSPPGTKRTRRGAAVMSASDPKRTLARLRPERALATFASDCDNLARRACNSLTQAPYGYYWHAELGADGKDYRANFVHAPFFPEILSSRVPLRARGPQRESAARVSSPGPCVKAFAAHHP